MTAKLISELKRYGVTPEALKEASEKDADTEFSKKLSDIALIYEEYDNLIKGKYSDAEENLISAIPGIKKSGLFEGEFFITGFKSFTPVEHLAITELMKISDITVSLCTDTLSDADGIFASSVHTYNKIKAEAEQEGIDIGENIFLEKKMGANSELEHLRDSYFKYPDNIYKEETQNISLITAKDGYDEVKKCAELISSLCREKGYKHKDFLILARNTESYKAAISAIFSGMGINCFINQQKSLSKNVFIRKVLAMAEILAYGFSYERIMPVVRFAGDGYTREEADIFENYVLASNITHKYWNSKEDWVFSPDEERIDLATVNKVKRLSVDRIIGLSESIKGRKTVSEICKALLNYIKEEKLDSLMAERVDEFNKKGKSDRALEYTRAWNDFSSVISQLEQCMGDEFITYEKFYEIIREAFAEIKINIAPPLSDQVTFAEIDTFRKSDAKVVFVLGLTDGVFPKGYIEEGMLSDIERDVLSEYGIELAPTADFKRREEQNLIYNVLTAPKEMLFLSVPLGNKDGKAKIRSEIVDRVLTIFPNLNRIEEMDALPDSPREIFKTL
ncbi:MAG: exodeoxyribonuclease V subunit gamma, partial [Clostridia bacterium]|nr:exodeoxyribonuclease V subunit gamma [Clostridia bacterium]